ncbi:zinc finger BED domain-containing protein 4-like isoform X1 [Cyprinodon tularosa]|uniref:zinc finger BED domain-containing protein 4-like isoform X1 n=1 Tax=Cyprinodon tularosa TaxID=77115 RepID=UPI0018E2755C|nr:zinc finger BED domain-containing protein 4-like isoform X1 [Cyprinodon tularosa]
MKASGSCFSSWSPHMFCQPERPSNNCWPKSTRRNGNERKWKYSRLRTECASIVGSSNEPRPGTSSQQLSAPTSDDLWEHFDLEVGRQTKSATADAILEVQRYMAEGNIARSQDPLLYWKNQRTVYPNFFRLALKFLCTPASSVPCERVFSTAGELI